MIHINLIEIIHKAYKERRKTHHPFSTEISVEKQKIKFFSSLTQEQYRLFENYRNEVDAFNFYDQEDLIEFVLDYVSNLLEPRPPKTIKFD